MSLQGNRFSDDGLARLEGKNHLKRLHIGLGGLRITDAGLAHLKGFEELEILDIQNSDVTAQGLDQLHGLPNLRELWLGETKKVSEEDTKAFKSCGSLI